MIKRINNIGYIKQGMDTYTFQMGDNQPYFGQRDTLVRPGVYPVLQKIDKYSVYPNGVNNLGPNIVKSMVSANRLLPELMEKKVKMLYGQGPMLYKIKKEGPKVWREYIDNPTILEWLESWKERGLADTYKEYLLKTIKSFYYDNGAFSKVRLSLGARTGIGLPIAGLESVSTLRARLATSKDLTNRTDFEDSDFDMVIIGNWQCISYRDYVAYPRFHVSEPFRSKVSISYAKNHTHGEEIYAYNEWFNGIKDWISGSNLTPAYINDYLKNAMSARMHIVIPSRWISEKRKSLEELCQLNIERQEKGEELLKVIYEHGIIEVGTEYSDNLLWECVEMELKKLTDYLSGEGKNQGKLYASISYLIDGEKEERWKIEEIPQKYKEYIEALTSYDKRADEVMLSAIGLDPSISNVTKDGIISKSGSDAYYNYLIYLNSLTIPEDIVCQDINLAIKINFPELYKEGYRIGFYRAVVEKQQDVPEQDRMKNQDNA